MRYFLSHIAQVVGGELIGGDQEVTCVVTDSRNNAPFGALFVALSSGTNDGHKYIGAMIERGCGAFLVTKVEHENGSFIVVRDTLSALQKLARYHREQFKGVVVAITGSNGKTIVKEWFAQLWNSKNGKLFRSPRSYNSQIGVALSLLMIEGDEAVAFIEAGISKVGEMERLEWMIKPDVGVLTNIGAAHSDGFENDSQKRCEKELLFKRVSKIVCAPVGNDIDVVNRETVIEIYKALGLSYKEGDLKSVAMRLELKEGICGSVIVNDSYSNDITSLGIALDFADRTPAKRRVVVLSDIASGDPKAVAQLVRDHKIDLVVGVGHNISKTAFDCQTILFENTTELLQNIDNEWFDDAVVLVKGGRVFEFERVVQRLENRTHTTVLEVNLERMAQNLKHYKTIIGAQTKIMAMIKAGGYGSGGVEVAAMLEHRGVDYLAVAYADEAVELRRGGIHAPIVVLNADCQSYQTMIENNLEPEIYSFDALQRFANEVVRVGATAYPIHIKIDSGMHRLGFSQGDINSLIEQLNAISVLKVASIFSHFAASEDPTEDEFSTMQFDYFKRCADQICNDITQNEKPLLHICNSVAIERFPQRYLDMVRLGVGLYTKTTVSQLVTRIAQVKNLVSGDTVGYNRRGVVDKPTKIAILPIGYADGLFRALGNGVGKFNVGGVLCPTIGNICMDTCIVDVTLANDVKEGDRVVIFGDNPTPKQLATSINTIDYEILTAVAQRIKRIYISE